MKKILYCLTLVTILVSCGKSNTSAISQAIVETGDAVSVSFTSAELSGIVEGPSDALKSLKFGVLYSMEPNPSQKGEVHKGKYNYQSTL